MEAQKTYDNGFHAVGVVLVLFAFLLVVFVGLRVAGGHKVAVKSEAAAAPAPAVSPALTVPSGWKLFADKSIGVQFMYPDVYGAFAKPARSPSTDYESALVSGRLTSDYLPGVSGEFTLGTYKKGSLEVVSRRYGPKIKLSGNEWTVVEPNQYDPKKYKKGDIYPEMTHLNSRGIDVYTSRTGDEGIMAYNLYFVVQGKLRQLQFPPFDSGEYSSTYNVNDQGPYDSMYTQVRDSVSLY
jgi:hypothetical protein